MASNTSARMVEIAEINRANGWYDDTRTMGDDIALLHSEVSEMFEAYRNRGVEKYTDENGKPDDFGSECADVYIRLLDTCYRYNINLDDEYDRKIDYNKTRGYRHGGKKI
jgi:NTP pyrophosphatase (non-canonical NTP hydrolase)